MDESSAQSARRLRTSQVTLQKMQLFCAVVDLGSVTRAAEQACIAQPAVTAQIRSLEDKIGATLLKRSGRSLILTEAGERVYRWATEMVARSYEIERELSGLSDGQAGSVVIASTMAAGSYIVTDIVIAFAKQAPGAHIAVQISNPKIALESLRNGSCDFAIIILDPSQDVAEFSVQQLWNEPLVLTAGRNYPVADRPLSNDELAALNYVTPPRGLVTRDLEDEMLLKSGISNRNIVLELGHPEALKRAMRAGLGVGFMPETTVRDDFAAGTLRPLATPGLQHFTIPVFLVHRRRKLLSALQRRVLDHIIECRPRDFALPAAAP